jgi:hypothetical protein
VKTCGYCLTTKAHDYYRTRTTTGSYFYACTNCVSGDPADKRTTKDDNDDQ